VKSKSTYDDPNDARKNIAKNGSVDIQVAKKCDMALMSVYYHEKKMEKEK
jgi:hypothetical protein